MAGRNLIAEIRALIADESVAMPTREKSRLQLDKWRLIHKHVHDHPFPTKPRFARSGQWRAAADHIRAIGEIDMLDWALPQAGGFTPHRRRWFAVSRSNEGRC